MIAALSLFGVLLARAGAVEADTLRITLAEARQVALATAPAIRMAAVETAAAAASFRAAGTVAANPSASVAWPASLAGGGDRFEAQITQPLDVTITRSFRSSVGASDLSRAGLMEADTRRVVEREVSIAFAELLASSRRAEVAADMTANLDRLLGSARARLDAGEISVLEADLVAVAAARVRPTLASRRFELRNAENRLIALLGLEPGTVVVAEESSALAGGAAASTSACRPDLMALHEQARGSRLRARLARVEQLPIPSIALVHEREPGMAGWWGIGLEMSLPIWSRGGAVAATYTAEADRAAIAAEAVTREIMAERMAIEERVAIAAETVALLRTAAVGIAGASSERLLEGYRAGQIDLVDMLRMRDELDQVRFDYWDAWEAHQRALAELGAAGSTSEGCNEGY